MQKLFIWNKIGMNLEKTSKQYFHLCIFISKKITNPDDIYFLLKISIPPNPKGRYFQRNFHISFFFLSQKKSAVHNPKSIQNFS